MKFPGCRKSGTVKRRTAGQPSGWGAEAPARRKKGVKTPGQCRQRLANDVGFCDKTKGHSGNHSNRWQRDYERKHGPVKKR